MAERARRRRGSSVTRLLGDLVDDSKDLVDDVLDRTKDVEHDVRRTARRTLDDDDDGGAAPGRDDEIDSLKQALDDLTAKVNRLVELQTDAQKPS